MVEGVEWLPPVEEIRPAMDVLNNSLHPPELERLAGAIQPRLFLCITLPSRPYTSYRSPPPYPLNFVRSTRNRIIRKPTFLHTWQTSLCENTSGVRCSNEKESGGGGGLQVVKVCTFTEDEVYVQYSTLIKDTNFVFKVSTISRIDSANF